MALVGTLGRVLRSPGLAVALLIAIALLAAVGTVTSPPAGREGPGLGPLARAVGLERTFSSPAFLGLVVAAALNVAFCTWHRLAPRLRARKGGWRAVTDLALHGSLLLVLAGGAAKGALGFVGTQNIHVGGHTDTVYDWRGGVDAPLGFRLQVEDFEERFYPARVRIGVRRAGTGEKVALIEAVEGRGETASPDGSLGVSVTAFDAQAALLRVEVRTARGSERLALDTRGGAAARARTGDYEVNLVAWRADLRQVRARIALAGPGAPTQVEWLSTNDRVSRGGASIFLTGWGRDEAGNRFCGFQVTRDPGAPLFWLGCILLALAAPAHLLLKGRGAGAGG